MKCALNKEPCAYCLENRNNDVAACIDCVAKRGSGMRGACAACSSSGGNAARCFSCLSSSPVDICPGTLALGPPDAPSCWVATDQTPCGICSTATGSEGAFKACVQCFKSSDGARAECQSCSYGYGCAPPGAAIGAARAPAPGLARGGRRRLRLRLPARHLPQR
jgi:hypothetical protein